MKCSVILIVLAVPLFAKAQTLKDTSLLQPVEVRAVRAGDKAPFAKQTIYKAEIAKNNLGQDLPFLLNQTPSAVVFADAGNGIGYTGIRIRGTDASRINVTLNGIPFNDAESQGTFFVNLPDFISSAGSVQVQRGVGTSTNGAGAFGATINISTNEINKNKYVNLNNTVGSFNTWRNTLQLGSGLFGKHFLIEGRLSRIASDGYIDRASSDLLAAAVSTAYIDDKNNLRLNIFTGKEKTYQAWYGVSENLLGTNRTFNPAGTEMPGNPYQNETDNYQQTHYQLFYNRKLSNKWTWNSSSFFTRGRGYYEQYKAGANLNRYGLPDYWNGQTLISETDIIRQLWLDNYFYGQISSFQFNNRSHQVIAGAGWKRYKGFHFGDIVWSQQKGAIPEDFRWYDLNALKTDFSSYVKWTANPVAHLQSFVDLQYRAVRYDINGFRENPGLVINNRFEFLNPKFGLTWSKSQWSVYGSYAKAAKEPNRDDFEAGISETPKAEKLHDFELGLNKVGKLQFSVNFYYMFYRDQLVLTGKINDVGAYTRTNIPESFRTGIELQAGYMPVKWFNIKAHAAFSRNKLRSFTEYTDDYDNGGQLTTEYKNTDISFSPNLVAGYNLSTIPVANLEINISGNYCSRQYLDNTQNRSRSLDPFFVHHAKLIYTLKPKNEKQKTRMNIIAQFNNIFNSFYEPNGYTFSYLYNGRLNTENYYYPMAGFNWMLGINIGF